MLTMSRTCNASECGSWKESYRSSDSVESSSEESDHSSNSSLNTGNGNGNSANGVASNNNNNNNNNNTSNNNSNNSNNNRANSNSHLQPPIGCITTHRVSTVIRPERKMPPIDPLQFVKIQKNELSKKAVEQIKLAEEEKITKEKIKEVEEEWQNNLMNWKSKRKLTKNNSEDESLPRNPNRKTKTFSEILNEKARSGGRIGYNLDRYIDPELEDEFNLLTVNDSDKIEKEHLFVEQDQAASTNMGKTALQKTSNSSSLLTSSIYATGDNGQNDASTRLSLMLNNNNISNKNDIGNGKSNLDRFLNTTNEQCSNNNEDQMSRNGLGEMVVFNTSLLEEFSVKTDCDIQKTVDNTLNANIDAGDNVITANTTTTNNNNNTTKQSSKMDKVNCKKDATSSSISSSQTEKVIVPINDWKSSHSPGNRKPSSLNITDDDIHQHNSSFELDEDEELDEESEKLRLDQERSFKAKVHTFEALAKQEEEAARRAAEENRKRQQKRAKLAAERSKSLSNLTAHPKHLLVASNSVSSSSLQNKTNMTEEDSIKTNNPKQNNRVSTNDDTYYQYYRNTPTNSVIYNFKEKSETGITGKVEKTPIKMATKTQTTSPVKVQTKPLNTITKLDHAQPSPAQSSLISPQPSNNIYENVSSLANNIHQNKISIPLESSNVDVIPDSDAIRNVSQKLLQQQQQIYQNQPMPAQIKPVPIVAPQPYTNEQHYLANNMPPHTYGGYSTSEMLDDHQLTGNAHRGYPISDDVGLPPIQITKSIQSIPPEEHPVYQNQMIMNPSCYHGYDNSYNNPETLMMNRREELVSSYRPEPFQQIPYSTTTNPYISTQNAYYPKPYTANNNGVNLHKPLISTKQPPLQSATRIPASQNANRYGANGYNPNHWVIQEAELRQSTQRMQQQSQTQMPLAPLPPVQTSITQQHQQQQQHPPPAPTPTTNNPLPTKNQPGYLSVSGKKKCSKCGDELGKGCAAMVVESLQLYYHINCFRCSVCNAQLGNGTVGTDVRVRNNKLHCHNCYSNDEAGLKFSRV